MTLLLALPLMAQAPVDVVAPLSSAQPSGVQPQRLGDNFVQPYVTPYETPVTVPATQLLSAKNLTGNSFRVGKTANPAGMLYSFTIESDYGTFRPQSLQMMRVRLQEMKALERLQEMSEEQVFLQGVGQQIENTARATGKALMSPIRTIKQMPDGFKKFAGDIQAQQAVGEVYGESGSPMYSQVKRDLAAKLGVDPYTDNLPLQELLNEVAKNRNRGQLLASLGTLVVGGGAGWALGAVELNQEFQDLIKNKSAQQLQVDNRQALLESGCSAPVVDRFLTTPGYTASNCTAITQAMMTLGKINGASHLLETLPPVEGAESVLFGQTQIQMAAHFHRRVKPLKSVRFVAGTAVWSDGTGANYVFSPLEHLYWNEKIDVGMQKIHNELPGENLSLWITGTATDTAMAELAARGIFVKPDASALLWPDA